VYFLAAVLPCAVPNLHQFSEQSLANIVFAFSSVCTGEDYSLLFASVAKEILSRVNNRHLDASVVMRLIKALSGAPRDACGAALGALFGLVSRHVDTLQQQDLQILARICANHLDLRRGHDNFSRKEVRGFCQQLSDLSSASTIAPCYTRVSSSASTQATSIAVEALAYAASAPAAEGVGGEGRLVYEVEDQEEVASERSSGEDGCRRPASEIQWICSVKNSFIHVECNSIAGESTDAGDGDENWNGSQCSEKPRSFQRSLSAPNLL
jgi:hypothetical protein